MTDFILTLLMAVLLVTAAIFITKYGLRMAGKLDKRLSIIVHHSFPGFQWYFRLPFRAGILTEYYFFLIIGKKNFFKTNWWPLKMFAYSSLLLFFAFLFNRTGVIHFYRYSIVSFDTGFLAENMNFLFWYLTGILIIDLIIIMLLLTESVRMHLWLAPVRIIIYLCLSILFSLLALFTCLVLLFFPLMYIVYRISGSGTFSKIRYHYSQFYFKLAEWKEKRDFYRQHRRISVHHGSKGQEPAS